MDGSIQHNEPVTLTVDDKLPTPIVKQIRDALSRFNRAHAGHDMHRDLFVALRDNTERTVGGLLGGTYFGYLHVDILWVDESYRRRGYGLKLLHAAEREAVRRCCRYAHLDTHGFQALAFYQKHGYEIVGELKDLPPGDSRYLLRKVLRSE